jgi:hypothetical protein
MYKQEQREKKRSSRNLRATRQLNEENVGGGRVYGEYNEGPYTAGAEYNWDEDANVGGHSKQVMEGPGYTWDEDANDDVGGGRVYGEYNEGPYTAGAEYNWDEEEGDESVGGWVSTAGGLIWKDMDRGVANGECNGRCQRRLRRMRFLSKCTKICVDNCSGAAKVRFGKVMRCYESLPICKRTGNKKKPWSVSGRKNDYRACRTPKRRN